MIVLINGAFGVGKTSVARALVKRLPRSILFDPELIGIALQRVTSVDDFQDLRSWRRGTILGLRVTRLIWPNVIVPMAFSNSAYLDEIRTAISRFEPHVHHFCLVAPVAIVHERLRRRGVEPAKSEWEYRRASECCHVHDREEFATQISAVDRDPDTIAEELYRRSVTSAL